jgi:hypothetical protein
MIQCEYESLEITFRADFAYLNTSTSKEQTGIADVPVAAKLDEQRPVALTLHFLALAQPTPSRRDQPTNKSSTLLSTPTNRKKRASVTL